MTNWYKTAQINSGKYKYGPYGELYILSKNTKKNEGPWRISYLDENKMPSHHEHFPTYEKALFVFNMLGEDDFFSKNKTRKEHELV